MKLIVTQSTWLKNSAKDSSKLPDTEKIFIRTGETFRILEDPKEEYNDHLRIFIEENGEPNYRFVFREHVEIEGTEPNNDPQDEPEALPEKPRERGRLIAIPGETDIHLYDPILGKGCNFNWAEMTKGGARLPINEDVVRNIKKVIVALEEVRLLFDSPITITSGYRPPRVNRRVGGSSQSRHIVGDAADFVVRGISPREVHRRLEPWWETRGGIASASTFTHIDCRGYKARWRYGR